MGIALKVSREAVRKSLVAHDGEEFATMTAIANSVIDQEPEPEPEPEPEQWLNQSDRYDEVPTPDDSSDNTCSDKSTELKKPKIEEGWVSRKPTIDTTCKPSQDETPRQEETCDPLQGKSVRELKDIISKDGGSPEHYLEKSELIERAKQALPQTEKKKTVRPNSVRNFFMNDDKKKKNTDSGKKENGEALIHGDGRFGGGTHTQIGHRDQCRYGMECKRKDPTHFKRFKHPPGFIHPTSTAPPAASRGDSPRSQTPDTPWRTTTPRERVGVSPQGNQERKSPEAKRDLNNDTTGDSVLEELNNKRKRDQVYKDIYLEYLEIS